MSGLRKQLNALKQGDPQAVAVVAILLFLASVAWFVWTTQVERDAVEIPTPPARPRSALPVPTPFSAFIEAEQNFRTGEKPANPFHLPWQPPAAPTRPPPLQVENSTRPPRPPPPPTPPPPAPTPIPSVTYVFKGMLTRPDGARIALVSEPLQGISHFVGIGDRLAQFTIGEISAEQITVVQGEDSHTSLRRGEPQTFELSP